MKKLKTISVLLLTLSVAILMSCKKEKVVAVEEKPVADVIYSQWSTAKNFRDSTVDNSLLRIADLPAPELTTELLEKSSVQVYFNFGGGVYPLPYTSFAGGKENVISFLPKLKKLIITRFTTDNTRSVALSTLLQYRYVIISKTEVVATKSAINLGDYNTVANYFHFTN